MQLSGSRATPGNTAYGPYAAAIDTSQPGRAAPVDQPAQQDRRRAGHPHSRRPLRHQKKPSLSGE
jgi:hypothetical protein